jgi:ubiquinol-cytochrome c reductase cytochrome c subunit
VRDSGGPRRAAAWSILLTVALVLFAAMPAYAAENEIYAARCAACHGSAGAGRGSIPALAGNPIVDDEAAVAEIIRSGRGNMPAVSDLSDPEIAGVTSFLRSTFGTGTDGGDGEGTATTIPPEEALPPGDADRGEAFFSGSSGLENGGSPCAACHIAGAAGRIAGPRILGTDLTDLSTRAGGAAGVGAMLEAPAFPVMAAAYDGRPLTEQERADLGAYFERLAAEGAPDDPALAGRLWIIGAAAALALFALMGLLWPRHRVTAAERLRGGSR